MDGLEVVAAMGQRSGAPRFLWEECVICYGRSVHLFIDGADDSRFASARRKN